MTLKDKLAAQRIYMLLGALFITSLVVSNLIFQKFFYWYPFHLEIFGTKLFEISVGILPYPITFLITDLISEIYGKKRANQIVVTGIFASIFSLTIVFVSNVVPATSWSPVGDQMFSTVFGNTALAVFASMLAYLFAQFIDIQIYHFWKRITKGKHLWLRNNFSTFSSQFVDTLTILVLLCSFEILQREPIRFVVCFSCHRCTTRSPFVLPHPFWSLRKCTEGCVTGVSILCGVVFEHLL